MLTIPPRVPTVSSFFPNTKSIGIIERGNRSIPQTYHSLTSFINSNSQLNKRKTVKLETVKLLLLIYQE